MRSNNYYTIITGASDGFGKALAIECAHQHMNLALVALPGKELRNLAGFIKKNFPVDVKIFEKDLTREADCYDLLLEMQQAAIKVNILVNNAGLGNTQIFSATSPELFKTQIQLNVYATTLLTSLFIPELKKNGPSHILNIGSLCSFFYLPKKQVYGATKSFIFFFSKCLSRELRNENISVSVACPGGMHTNFQVSMMNRTGNFLSRMSTLSPEEVAPIVIREMLRGKEVIVPGMINKLSLLLDKLLPSYFKNMFTDRLMQDLKTFKQPTIAAAGNSSPMVA